MKIYDHHITECDSAIPAILVTHFLISEETAYYLYKGALKSHFDRIRENVKMVIETDYVDKFYRNSYYNYYASKLNTFQRNCIKVSFFEDSITMDDFRLRESLDKIKGSYLGFFLLRPTEPSLLGRSVLSPKALKENNFVACTASIPTTSNAIRLQAVGFPHSSQDNETLKCAEVTIWAVLEYFGNKYPDYVSVLPSAIMQKLKDVSRERQLPSKGLQVGQISYTLREFGLGTKIYTRDEYGEEMFKNILSCYIESGFPLILAVGNDKYISSPGARPDIRYIGHAVICIGRDIFDPGMIDACPEFFTLRKMASYNDKLQIYDFDDLRKQFVFIDDNRPAYQKTFLNNPMAYYGKDDWGFCDITEIIVPLHTRTYLEAYQVKNFVINLLTRTEPYKMRDGSRIVTRTYLAASRTYKQYIAFNTDIPDHIKNIITELSMPKFIWVTEWADIETFKTRKVEGIIILDSTEPNLFEFEPLIFAAFQEKMLYFDQEMNKFQEIDVTLPPFEIFEGNLEHIQ